MPGLLDGKCSPLARERREVSGNATARFGGAKIGFQIAGLVCLQQPGDRPAHRFRPGDLFPAAKRPEFTQLFAWQINNCSHTGSRWSSHVIIPGARHRGEE
jgi:hypothetical protein